MSSQQTHSPVANSPGAGTAHDLARHGCVSKGTILVESLEPADCDRGDAAEAGDLHGQGRCSLATIGLWTVVNILATVGIVFVNKGIFSESRWKLCQLMFACYHFLVTWIALFILSRPPLNIFVPVHATWCQSMPLAVAMCLSVIFQNLSLAHSSVTFYQVVRILLTPTVAGMNYVIYNTALPRNALLALVPTCAGVGVVSYYESVRSGEESRNATSALGVIFGFVGVLASSIYTIWIGSYHVRLRMSSMQLLYNQTPIAALVLLFAIPFLDTFPEWTAVPGSTWQLMGLSGALAVLINVSQFFIVSRSGAVSSTVVGHVKTCTIVGLGWMTTGGPISAKSVIGVLMAIAGIMLYSLYMAHNT